MASASQTATGGSDPRPLVSLIVPAYNEESILSGSLARLLAHLDSLAGDYRWEVLVVDDGSRDATGELAEAFAAQHPDVRVFHHPRNLGPGQAFRTAFAHYRGDYVITLDVDLSYAPEHIPRLLSHIRETGADVVAASPYMRGGRLSNIPWLRRALSVAANRFLKLAARGSLSTLTSMMRIYDGGFLRRLSLRSAGMEISPEIIYKSMLLQGRIEEIPGHLDWGQQHAAPRRSSMKILRHTVAVLLSGFLFRPVMFFILPGLALLALSVYANGWVVAHVVEQWSAMAQHAGLLKQLSASAAAAFTVAPHTFIIGGMTLILAVQLLGLGILALQSKSYFEEVYHLGSTMGGPRDRAARSE